MKLSRQALQILQELKTQSPRKVSSLEKEGYDQSMVNRAALELQEEGLAEINEEEELDQRLTDKGEEVVENGSPEHRLIQELEEGDKAVDSLELDNADVALGKAKRKGWIDIQEGEVGLTKDGSNAIGKDELQQRLDAGNFSEQDEKRGLVETVRKTEQVVELTEKGEDTSLDEIEEDFRLDRVKTPRTGKKHFYKNIIDYARDKWVEMGFEEMSGDFVVPSLLNFDALYTPQDHTARELHDTFFIENPATANLDEYGNKVEHVKETHEDGWTTGSDGWNYDWSEEETKKNVLRTHTTSVSARKLHELEEEDLPKKFFTVARNFRNETVDRSHLAEFYQTDGIVVGKGLTFQHLKGYISEFFEKMGYEEFRLIPSYYPYTEMSVEVQVYDEDAGEWLGMGGAGMFRPEVVKPMLGFEASVLAWGLGVGRIAMKAAGLSDIRELYRNDLEILEQTPVWRPERGGN